MMKKRAAALILVMLLVCAAGCSGEDETSGKSDYSKYCTIGDYKGLTITVDAEEAVTDEDVEDAVQSVLSSSASTKEVTDRTVEEGDTVDIDYVGKIDGEEFDGGTGSYDLTIGSGAFIDGFEDGLIGAESGEVRDVVATFPDPYTNNPDLAGCEAVFTVTVNAIYEPVPAEWTDAWVADNSDYATTEEYEEALRAELEEERQEDFETAYLTAIFTEIMSNSEYDSYPEDEMKEYKDYWDSYSQLYAAYAGYSDFDQFLTDTGMDEDSYDEWLTEMAELSCEEYLIYVIISDEEDITASTTEVNAAIEASAESAGLDEKEYLETYGLTEDDFKFNIICGKVEDFLMENNTAVTE